MPKPHNELFIRTGLQKVIETLKQYQTQVLLGQVESQDASVVTGMAGLERCIDALSALQEVDLVAFGAGGNMIPSGQVLIRFSEICENALSALKGLEEYTENSNIKNKNILDASNYIKGDIVNRISLELKPYMKLEESKHEWNLTSEQRYQALEVISRSRNTIKAKSEERVSKKTEIESKTGETSWVEYPDKGNPFTGTKLHIPWRYQVTGSIEDLAGFYVTTPGLSDEEKLFIERRIGSLLHIEDISRDSREYGRTPVFNVDAHETQNGLNFRLTGIEGKYQAQTTTQGCWSCAYAMLLESRGISMNQQILRQFRPNLGIDETKSLDYRAFQGLVSDMSFGPFELADLANKLLPTTAMRQVIFRKEDGQIGQKDKFLEYVRDAIVGHQSPIAMQMGGHFVSIVGVENGQLLMLDSDNENPNEVISRPVDDVLRVSPLSLIWLHDLTFDKDGRCTNIPDSFGKVHYMDGQLTNISDGRDKLNVSGASFSAGINAGNGKVEESIYLPESVPEKILHPEDKKEEIKAETKSEIKAETKSEIKAETKSEIPNQRNVENEKEKETNTQEKEIKNAPLEANKDDTWEELKYDEGEELKNETKIENKGENESSAQKEDPVSAPKKTNQVSKQKENDSPKRKAILAQLEASKNRLRDILLHENTMENSEQMLRHAVASLIAERMMLEVYDRSQNPKYEKQKTTIKNKEKFVEDIMMTKQFNQFFKEVVTRDDLKAICLGTEEQCNEAMNRLYKKFMTFVKHGTLKEETVSKNEPNPKESTGKEQAKTEPSKQGELNQPQNEGNGLII